MSNLGMGVMMGMLLGNNESNDIAKKSIGKQISKVWLGDDDALHFRFSDGTGMRIEDKGQSCCEYRYMRTDDNLNEFIGATLIGAEIKDAPNMLDEYGEHEVQFLEVKTSMGEFTMSSHNEHNGYYGGFWIQCSEESGGGMYD